MKFEVETLCSENRDSIGRAYFDLLIYVLFPLYRHSWVVDKNRSLVEHYDLDFEQYLPLAGRRT